MPSFLFPGAMYSSVFEPRLARAPVSPLVAVILLGVLSVGAAGSQPTESAPQDREAIPDLNQLQKRVLEFWSLVTRGEKYQALRYVAEGQDHFLNWKWPPTPLSLSAGLLRPGPRRQGIGFASLRALDGSGPSLGDSLFMRERGELQRRGSPPGPGLHKERFCKTADPDGLFNGLGGAKRYCREKGGWRRVSARPRDTLATACPTGLQTVYNPILRGPPGESSTLLL